jgi:hypothetical protein
MQAFPRCLLWLAKIFAARVAVCTKSGFASIKQTLAKTLLPTLFGDEYDGLPVKWAGLVIPDPTTLVQPIYDVIILLCSHILAAFRHRCLLIDRPPQGHPGC